MHGARAGRPIIHGRYSTSLKGQLQAAYLASLDDPSLLDVRQTIAGMDAIAKAQGERLEDEDGPTFRRTACELLSKYRAENAKEHGSPASALEALFDHLEAGNERMQAEMDLFEMLERIDKRVSDAVKNEHAKTVSVPAARIIELLVGVLAAVYRHVEIEKARKVEHDLSKLFGVDAPVIDALPVET